MGLSQNVILWVDNNHFEGENEENSQTVDLLIKRCWHKNIKIILKSESETAWSYIYSEFFRISINICKKFKIISNKVRDDLQVETLPYSERFRKQQELRRWHCGPLFL